MSHSKKNNTRAFFTAHERAELKGQWGANSTRLTRESFLPFGSCNLCLIQAEDPVACPDEGHLFCRECALSNLLAQTKEIKRLQKAAKRRAADDAEERELKTAEAQYKELDDFEKAQQGIDRPRTGDNLKRARTDDDDNEGNKRRKSQDNTDNKDTSFWIPSQKGDAKSEIITITKKHPTCPAGSTKQAHDLSLKSLIDVKFATQDDKSTQGKLRVCPSCNKTLSNSTKAMLARTCGHVLCKSCSERFQDLDDKTQVAACFTCTRPVSPADSVGKRINAGLIMLKSDATGFAGAGDNTVKKQGVAFQFG